jgi:hypothetical protein
VYDEDEVDAFESALAGMPGAYAALEWLHQEEGAPDGQGIMDRYNTWLAAAVPGVVVPDAPAAEEAPDGPADEEVPDGPAAAVDQEQEAYEAMVSIFEDVYLGRDGGQQTLDMLHEQAGVLAGGETMNHRYATWREERLLQDTANEVEMLQLFERMITDSVLEAYVRANAPAEMIEAYNEWKAARVRALVAARMTKKDFHDSHGKGGSDMSFGSMAA